MENKRLKIGSGPRPVDKSPANTRYGARAAGEKEWPDIIVQVNSPDERGRGSGISGFTSGGQSGGGQPGPPGPGRGSAQTIFPRGQPHRVYATDLWPALALDNYSRSKSDRAPRQRLIDSG